MDVNVKGPGVVPHRVADALWNARELSKNYGNVIIRVTPEAVITVGRSRYSMTISKTVDTPFSDLQAGSGAYGTIVLTPAEVDALQSELRSLPRSKGTVINVDIEDSHLVVAYGSEVLARMETLQDQGAVITRTEKEMDQILGTYLTGVPSHDTMLLLNVDVFKVLFRLKPAGKVMKVFHTGESTVGFKLGDHTVGVIEVLQPDKVLEENRSPDLLDLLK